MQVLHGTEYVDIDFLSDVGEVGLGVCLEGGGDGQQNGVAGLAGGGTDFGGGVGHRDFDLLTVDGSFEGRRVHGRHGDVVPHDRSGQHDTVGVDDLAAGTVDDLADRAVSY